MLSKKILAELPGFFDRQKLNFNYCFRAICMKE